MQYLGQACNRPPTISASAKSFLPVSVPTENSASGLWGLASFPASLRNVSPSACTPGSDKAASGGAACATGPWHFFCTFFQPFSCTASVAFREGKEAVTLWVLQTAKPPWGTEREDRSGLSKLHVVLLSEILIISNGSRDLFLSSCFSLHTVASPFKGSFS